MRKLSLASKAVGPLSNRGLKGSDGKFAPSSLLPMSPWVVSNSFDQVKVAPNCNPFDTCLLSEVCRALYQESPSVVLATQAARFGLTRYELPTVDVLLGDAIAG